MMNLPALLLLGAGVLAAGAPFVLDSGGLFVLIEILTLLAIAQSWNLLAGYAGLISLGHHVFIACGAYALYVLTRDLPLSPYFAIPVAGLAAMALAVLLFPILFRLRAVYFAIGMWVAAEVARLLVAKSDYLGGPSGLPLVAARDLDRAWFMPIAYWYALGTAIGLTLGIHLLVTSIWGLHLRAMRDDDLAARSLGVNTARQKGLVFVLSAGGCGVAGAVWFMTSLFITPGGTFDMTWIVAVIFVCIIGGLGTLRGPFLGTALYFALREGLDLPAGWNMILLGVVAVTVVIALPRGLASLTRR